MGYIFPANASQPVGTVPLLHWYNGTREDNFATSDPNWGAPVGTGTVQGYEFVRKMGYIYPS